MFAPSYVEMLKRQQGVENAKEFAARQITSERVWRVPEIESVRYFAKGGATVEALGRWENEGYEGVQTFIFELAHDGQGWKILDIMR